MLKKLLPILLMSAFILAACQPAPAVPGQPTSSAPMEGCKVTALVPTPNPTIEALLPPVSAEDHILGAKDALVTIVEYSDFQCPYCSMLAPVLTELVKKYPDDLRLVYRFFPLSSHSNALVSAYAAEAAGRQDKFFEFSEFLFANQAKWGGLSNDEAAAWFAEQSAQFKMDPEKFKSDFASDTVRQVVDKSLKIATDAQVPGTPFLLINGQPYQSNMDIVSMSALVEFFKLSQRAYKTCPPMVIDPKKKYEATLKTEKGDIVVKLYADKAPLAVNSFVFLAREGWFNNTTFHRVIKNFVAQGGDPSASGFGGPGYTFNNEYKDAVFNKGGLLAMANNGADTNGSQFFITFAQAPNLNGGYTLFGEVLKGMNVAEQLTERNPDSAGAPLPPGDKLISIEIKEK
jgi:cyclophilin family peptidyl-prolyl cis-trans isomerase/protein-disulfide isomerase